MRMPTDIQKDADLQEELKESMAKYSKQRDRDEDVQRSYSEMLEKLDEEECEFLDRRKSSVMKSLEEKEIRKKSFNSRSSAH